MTEAFEVIPVSPLRKIIAARMTDAIRNIPHFRLTAEVEFDALRELRQELRDRVPEADVSLNDLLIKLCASALMDVPTVNLQWVGDEIHQYRNADIAVVTAVYGGVVTPVIRQADTKSIFAISREARDLIQRARRNALKMTEITGGSFSLSNLGMYGVDEFDAVISPPQCAILAVAAAKRRVAVVQDETTRIASIARLTLSLDHRAIDGATGARFLAALKCRVENPSTAGVGP